METKYTKEQALKIIINSAKIYKSNLLNRQLCFLYKDNRLKKLSFCTVKFHKHNFLHFVGVDTELKANKFFEKAYNNTLTAQDFQFKDEFTTFKKYNIIGSAMRIAYNAKMIGQFGNKGIKIKADIGVGNVSYVMTIGIDDSGKLYPKGIIEDDVRLATYSASPIVAVLSKEFAEKSFNTVTYKSKNINIENLHFPKEIRSMLTDDAYYTLKPSAKEQDIAKQTQREAAATKEPIPQQQPKLSLSERLAAARNRAAELNSQSHTEKTHINQNNINLD